MTRFPFCSFSGLTLALAATSLMAQSTNTGQFHGRVTDAQGRPLAQVKVLLTSPQMLMARTVTTDARGEWRAPLLSPGSYQISFSREGFVGTSLRNLRLGAGAALFQGVTLKPAAEASAVVEVTATSTLADKADTKTSMNFSSENLMQFTGGRSMASALSLAPGVAAGQGDGQVSIRGGQANNTQFTLNGNDIKDPLVGTVGGSFYIEDNVEDIAVVLSPQNARFGRALGGAVNVVTKSGGNTFEGSLRSEYGRGTWGARSRFQDFYPADQREGGYASDALERSWFVTLSGPIVNDRLWFSYGTQIKPATSSGSTMGIPDKRYRRPLRTNNAALDALTAVDPNGNDKTGYAALPTAAPQIRGWRIPGFDFGENFSNRNTYNYHEGKLTFAFNENHKVQFFGSHTKSESDKAGGGGLWLAQNSPSTSTNFQWGLGYNAILGASTFLEVQVSRLRNAAYYPKGDLSRDPQNNPVTLWLDMFTGPHTMSGLGKLTGTGQGSGVEEKNSQTSNVNLKLYRETFGVSHDIDLGLDLYRADIHSDSYFGGGFQEFRAGGLFANANGDWLIPTLRWVGPNKFGQSGSGLTGLAPTMMKYYAGNGQSQSGNTGLYLNDQISLNRHWNVMLGLRVDRTDVKDGVTGKSILPVATGISPRFVVTFDPRGDNTHVFKASLLRLTSDYPTSLTNNMFQKAESRMVRWGWGGVKGMNQPLPGTPGDMMGGVDMLGLRFVTYQDLVNPANYTQAFYFTDKTKSFQVDSGIRPMTNDELSLEYRRQYAGGSYLRMAYVYRKMSNLIAFAQDWGPDRADQWVRLDDFTGNGLQSMYSQVTRVFNSKDLWRDYHAVEMEASLKMTSRFQGRLSYTYSRLRGNDNAGEMAGSPVSYTHLTLPTKRIV